MLGEAIKGDDLRLVVGAGDDYTPLAPGVATYLDVGDF